VVEVKSGVVKEAPVCMTVALVAVAYHLNTGFITLAAVAVKVVELPSQISIMPDMVMLEDVDGEFTVTVTAFLPIVLAKPSQ
jgi:hypothetical protein